MLLTNLTTNTYVLDERYVVPASSTLTVADADYFADDSLRRQINRLVSDGHITVGSPPVGYPRLDPLLPDASAAAPADVLRLDAALNPRWFPVAGIFAGVTYGAGSNVDIALPGIKVTDTIVAALRVRRDPASAHQSLVAGATALTNIAVAGLDTLDTIVSVFQFHAGSNPVNRTSEVSIASAGNIQLSTTNTTGDVLMVTYEDGDTPPLIAVTVAIPSDDVIHIASNTTGDSLVVIWSR